MASKKIDRAALRDSEARVKAVQERRRSSASGAHDSRPKRTRTRAAQREAALREW